MISVVFMTALIVNRKRPDKSFHCFPSDLILRIQAIKRVAGRNIKLSESEQKLREELQKAQEKNTELEKSLDARSKEVIHPRSQLFPFDNKKVDSKQLEFFTSLGLCVELFGSSVLQGHTQR